MALGVCTRGRIVGFATTRSAYGKMLLAGAVALGIVAGTARPAHATFTIFMRQQLADVVVIGGGSFNTAAMTLTGNIFSQPEAFTNPRAGELEIGKGTVAEYLINNLQGTNAFGPFSPGTFTSNTTGDPVGLNVANTINTPPTGLFYLPVGYVSGTLLSNDTVFKNTTLAAIGVFDNVQFNWSWGFGPTFDSLVLRIGSPPVEPPPVPEPTSALLLGSGLLGLAAMRRSRARSILHRTSVGSRKETRSHSSLD